MRVAQGKECRLVGRMTAGDGGYDPGPVIRTVDGRLSGGEADRLGKLIRKLAFWDLPVFVEGDGFDGTTWVLEGTQAGRYHVVHRWCPNKSEFAKFCAFLGQLGGFHAG